MRSNDTGDASDTADREGSIGEDTLTVPKKGLKVSDAGRLRTNPSEPDGFKNAVPTSVQNDCKIVKEFYSQNSYRYKVYISACFKRGDDQGVIWQRWPLDWLACELEGGVNVFQEFPEVSNFLSSAVLLSFRDCSIQPAVKCSDH